MTGALAFAQRCCKTLFPLHFHRKGMWLWNPFLLRLLLSRSQQAMWEGSGWHQGHYAGYVGGRVGDGCSLCRVLQARATARRCLRDRIWSPVVPLCLAGLVCTRTFLTGLTATPVAEWLMGEGLGEQFELLIQNCEQIKRGLF